jgi:hypothetical protein
MNKREHWCSRLLSAPVAVAVTSIENVRDLEAHRIARTPTSQKDSHGGLHRKPFYQVPSYGSLAGLQAFAIIWLWPDSEAPSVG